MKRLVYILAIAIGVMVAGCESDIELQKKGRLGYVLNALLIPDTCITAYISEYYTVGSIPDDRAYGEPPGYLQSFFFATSGDHLELKGIPKTNPVITYSVNSVDMGQMRADTLPKGKYFATYVPKPGDRISIRAKDPSDPKVAVEASAVLPAKPKFEILSLDKVYNPMRMDDDIFALYGDTMVRISIKIHDRQGEKNYYRLMVRGFYNRPSYLSSLNGNFVDDVIDSDDPILAASPKGEVPGSVSHTSFIFTDASFDGREKTLTLTKQLDAYNADMYWGEHRCMSVEVEEITADFYKYIESTCRYNLSDRSVYTEPVPIHSNTSTGYGILGALSYSRVVVNPDTIRVAEEQVMH